MLSASRCCFSRSQCGYYPAALLRLHSTKDFPALAEEYNSITASQLSGPCSYVGSRELSSLKLSSLLSAPSSSDKISSSSLGFGGSEINLIKLMIKEQ
jgi:hypothetical protein